jgi:NAD(P)-dependent dehydrogenase (short-subunit alcohol dehydrogenase family)
MTRPNVLITGCSSGIGLAAAGAFADAGFDVLATMRDVGRADPSLAARGIEVRRLDVADDSAAAAVQAVIADRGGIDVVVSNAGIGIDGTTEELTVDDFRRSFETNVIGSVRLLQAVLPTWRAAGAGRFVAVSSIAGVFGQPFNDAYCASKAALEVMVESLHPVVAAQGIHLSLVEAGPVAGEFQNRYAGSGRDPSGPYAAARDRFRVVQDGGYAAAQTPAQIAAFLLQVATTEAPVLRYQTSEAVTKLVALKLKDLTGERITGLTARWT